MPLDKFSIRGSPSTAQREVRDASSSPLGQSLHQARRPFVLNQNLVPGRSARLNGRASQEITCLVSVATASGIADATQLGDPCSQPRPTGSEAHRLWGVPCGPQVGGACSAAMIFGFPYTAESEPLNVTLNGSPPNFQFLACTARRHGLLARPLSGTQVIQQRSPIRASSYKSRIIIGQSALL